LCAFPRSDCGVIIFELHQRDDAHVNVLADIVLEGLVEEFLGVQVELAMGTGLARYRVEPCVNFARLLSRVES
jgi:hypothetical protein